MKPKQEKQEASPNPKQGERKQNHRRRGERGKQPVQAEQIKQVQQPEANHKVQNKENHKENTLPLRALKTFAALRNNHALREVAELPVPKESQPKRHRRPVRKKQNQQAPKES